MLQMQVVVNKDVHWVSKRHPRHCTSKKDYPNLVIFDRNIFDTTGHQMTVTFPPHPTPASALPEKSRTREIRVEMNHKTSKKFFISPDSWPPTAGRLQGLTVVQHW